MNSDPKISSGCSESFAELCALSTTGSLTEEEWRTLRNHIAKCASCAALLADYQSLTSSGMAMIGAVREIADPVADEELSWARADARARLRSGLNGVGRPELRFNPIKPAGSASLFSWPVTRSLASVAAVLILLMGLAYQLGFKRGTRHPGSMSAPTEDAESLLRRQLSAVQQEQALLNDKVATDAKTIGSLEGRATRAESDLSQLRDLKAKLETKIQDLNTQNGQQSELLATLSKERIGVQQELQKSEDLLQSVRQELKASQEERQRVLLHSASLETQVDQLQDQLHDQQETSGRQEEFLASDRDIRDLMGARQLYIADVFDIDPQGNTKKPYGRVFYTKCKSLIFYAFDLDQQPGYKDAKAFQAWGRPGSSQATPVSLGIFYMDNEKNRRWALKANDPRVLDQINAVFVTVEPQGGSKKPTNKPFLVAYLHTAPPNHP
jgi:hypothetical protein